VVIPIRRICGILFHSTKCLQNESFIKPNFLLNLLHVFVFLVSYKIKMGTETKDAERVSVSDFC
jgi:hypothetical protein